MIAAPWWQGMKEIVQKFFAKAAFRQTKTIEPGTSTYSEDNSEEINDAWQQL